MCNILKISLKNLLDMHKNKIISDEKYINVINPVNILKKGYTVTLLNGYIVQSINQIHKKDRIETVMHDGRISSTVD